MKKATTFVNGFYCFVFAVSLLSSSSILYIKNNNESIYFFLKKHPYDVFRESYDADLTET